MPDLLQASAVSVYDAGVARQCELARAALALEDRFQPIEQIERSALHLRFGLESAALLADSGAGDTVRAYLQHIFGLLGAGLNPLLAPALPAIPSQGAIVRPRALLLNGRPVLLNGQPLIVAYYLVVATGPTYNTTLLPTQTAGPVTYNGLSGTELSFNAPLPTGGAQFLKLYVAGMQVGRVDFPAAATGAGFSLLYQGTSYYGTFQSTSDNTLTLS